MIYFLLILAIIFTYIFYVIYFIIRDFPNIRASKSTICLSYIFVSFFFFVFFFFFRILNLFRPKNSIDLLPIFDFIRQNNIIILIIILFCFMISVKCYVYFLKLNFLKIHYYLLNFNNFKYNDYYAGFIYFFVTWPKRIRIFFLNKEFYFLEDLRNLIYFFLKYAFTFLMLLIFLYDFFQNDLILKNFSYVLPFYSLYQILFSINSFLYFDLEYLFDLVITDNLYPYDNSHNLFYILFDKESNDIELKIVCDYLRNKILKLPSSF